MNENARVKSGTIDVRHVAHLARLSCTEEEVAAFQRQLSQVVGYFQDIATVDVAGVEPTAHAIRIQNVFRPDAARPGLPREKVLANAPDHDEEQILVPVVLG